MSILYDPEIEVVCHPSSNSVRNCFALGIVADSPQAWELASMPRTMSEKPDGELASRNAQIKINNIIT
jgi:hypothetical protein